MGEGLEGIETTALLVNESRARRPGLSGDTYAGVWIPEERREDVRRLWEDYAASVYPDDDVVTSVRCRAVLDVLGRAVASDPAVVLVSLGCGFTSYPWLLPLGESVEVDLPSVIAAKAERAARLTEAGLLPDRRVHQLAADLDDPGSLGSAVEQIDRILGGRAAVVVIEGVLYYLDRSSCARLLQLPSRLGARAVAVSYWPPSAESNPVLERQARWFTARQIPPTATFLEVPDLLDGMGLEVQTAGPEELQRRYGLAPVVGEDALVPEYVATWEQQ